MLCLPCLEEEYPAIGMGTIIILLWENKTHRYIGQVVLGFLLPSCGIQIIEMALKPPAKNA